MPISGGFMLRFVGNDHKPFFRAVAAGDNDAISALIDWLVQTGDPRAECIVGAIQAGDLDFVLAMFGLRRKAALTLARKTSKRRKRRRCA
jgi:hypothetical protein